MKRIILMSLCVVIAGGAVAAYNEVPLKISKPDRNAAAAVVQAERLPKTQPRTFRDEVKVILAVQDRILKIAPIDRGIPEGRPRELVDLIKFQKGLCYDRSRAIEITLRSLGFETRHASIYSTAKTRSALRSFVTPGVDSHAVTEVKTRLGWMLVDSNQRWIGLRANGRPVDLGELRRDRSRKWSILVHEPTPAIYTKGFTWAYGLYSRHGRFYAPYNAVPDVNWSEIIQNL